MSRNNKKIVWDERELASNPHEDPQKAKKVELMFDSISSSYDFNNRVHSFGLDQFWRKRVVTLAERKKGDSILDVACGTGDLTQALASGHIGKVKGIDFTKSMLAIACHKREKLGLSKIEYQHADAMNLKENDSSWDLVTISFGLRNIGNWKKSLSEFQRVIKPGGRLIILEFTEPPNKLVRFSHRIYTHYIMPFTATLFSRDKSGAYRYLPKSVEKFPNHNELALEIESLGFKDVKVELMTLGTVAIIQSTKA